MFKRLFALALALIMAFSLLTITASAANELIENTYPNAVPMTVGQKIEVGGRQTLPTNDKNCVYYSVDMKYTFTVSETCVTTITLSTETPPAGYRDNCLYLHMYCADAKSEVVMWSGKWEHGIAVQSDAMPLSKDYIVKLGPGTYYVKVDNRTARNAFGWVELKSITPMQDDFNGEPNDTTTLAQARPGVSTGVDYTGNIRYDGKQNGNSYGGDNYDYYRFDVPSDGYSVKLTASRADIDSSNNIKICLVDAKGKKMYSNEVDLDIFPSGECEYENLKQGMYFVYVNGWPANAHMTEYTFRLDPLSGSTPTSPTSPEPPVSPAPPTAPSGTAPNIDSASGWAHDNINEAYGNGLVPTALQSAYKQATTRAEFCALAVALYETVTGSEITARQSFTDTSDVNVEKMAALGVVNGVGNNMFAPYGTLTREQAATMLSRLGNAMGKPLTKQAATFNDNGNISDWAFEAVGQMQATGIMEGVGNNTFAPKADYTREQSITTLLRMYGFVK